jgi:peptidoglycan-N-acetylglucosamine deacetylase
MTPWPLGRAAAAFTFDFDAEEVWIGEDPSNADRPGVLSQGTYGAKVAVPLVLDVLQRRGVRATFFVPGRVAERHPGRVEEIVARGHEIGHHGYTHTSPTKLRPEEEERELVKGREVLESFGAEVRGYRSPSWDFSEATLGLLERHGFAYSSNLMDDIRPYRHEGSAVTEVPIQWILDDAPHFWFDPASWTKKISTVEEVRSIWEREVLGIRELGGAAVLTCHPQIIGRPGRIGFLDEFIGSVQALDDVWIATAGEIAEHAP